MYCIEGGVCDIVGTLWHSPQWVGAPKTLVEMSKTLVENSSTLVQLIEEMREIRKSQQFLSDQYEEMKKHLQSTDEEVKTLRIENQDLKNHVCKLEAESGQMQEDINNL